MIKIELGKLKTHNQTRRIQNLEEKYKFEEMK